MLGRKLGRRDGETFLWPSVEGQPYGEDVLSESSLCTLLTGKLEGSIRSYTTLKAKSILLFAGT